MPKSISLARRPAPSSSRAITFWGLTSRWIDPVLVRVLERLADVGAELGDVAVAEVALAGELVEGRAGDQLADEQRAVAVDAHLIQGHDPGMVEAGGGLGLAHDAVRVPDHDLLDGDVALQALVEGAVDRAHPARADALAHAEPVHHQLFRHSIVSFAAP